MIKSQTNFRYEKGTDKPCLSCIAKKDCTDYIHQKHIEKNDIWDSSYTCNFYTPKQVIEEFECKGCRESTAFCLRKCPKGVNGGYAL